MIDLVKNNYYRKIGSGADFSVEFDRMPSTTLNHTEESKKAAIELYDLKQGTLHLCYSGGVDSEFMLSIFMELGIPFVPVVFKIAPDINNHDLEYCTNFCESKNLKPKIVDIDFDHFLKSGKLLDVCKEIKTNIWIRAGLCEGLKKLDGTILLGDCEPYVGLDQQTMAWNLKVDEHEFAWGNFYKQHGIHGTPYFGAYTPEKYMAFLYNQRIQDIINNRLPGKLGTSTSKVIVYNSDNNFNLELRPKYHGYEFVGENELLKEIEKEIEHFNGHYSIEVHSFIKKLTHV